MSSVQLSEITTYRRAGQSIRYGVRGRPVKPIAITQDTRLIMKTFVFGMYFFGSLAPILAAQSSSDNDWALQACYCSGGAIIGAGILFCREGAVTKFHELARIALANVLTAAAFGPGGTWYFCQATGIHFGINALVPVGATIGLAGAGMLAVLLPILMKSLPAFFKSKSGLPDDDHHNHRNSMYTKE